MPEIVIDTDNIFHRIYSVVKKKEYFREDMAGRNKLIGDVDNFCKSIKNSIPHSFVVMTMDSPDTWRSKLYDSYKQNRDNDRTFLRSCMDEFFITRGKDNCIIKIPEYEGDDIISAIADVNMDKGVSTVIVSSDSDLNQLVKCGGDDKFVVQYDPDASKKMFYIDHKFQIKVHDIFDDHMIDDLYIYSQTNHKLINPNHKLIIKLISGDIGDNIPSCYTSINGKNRGFGEKSAEKIALLYQDLEYYIDPLKRREVISKILKTVNSSETSRIDEISDNMGRNVNLIYLNENCIQDYANLKKLVTQKLKYR